jgi:anti-sigma regulatory factor (Ser/Thr protein kinase)
MFTPTPTIEVRKRRINRSVFSKGAGEQAESKRNTPTALSPLSSRSLRDLRQQVEGVAMELRMPQTRIFDLIIATGERAMNAVRHGGGGTGSIGVDS